MSWIETQRGSVENADADARGRMHVPSYTGRFSEAVLATSAALGVTPDVARKERWGISTVRQRVRFLNALRVGDFLYTESGVAQLGNKSLMQVQRMSNAATGAVAATMEQTIVLLDLDARRGLAWPPAMRERAQAMQVPWDAPAPEFPPTPEGLDGFRDTYRGIAMPWEVDPTEHLSVEFYIRRFASAVGHLLLRIGAPAGFAIRDYVVTYRRECRAGNMMQIKSAVTERGDTVLKTCHKMLDPLNGEPIATLEALLAR
jgi:acyl-CoA thioester hydrolase